MTILVLNAGSSSLKFALFDQETGECVTRGTVSLQANGLEESAVGGNHGTIEQAESQLKEEIARVASWSDIRMVTHRLVQGGGKFSQPILLTSEVESQLSQLISLAPLHMPPALDWIKRIDAIQPGIRQAAVFDTGFFHKLPPRAYRYPVPERWFIDHGVRRYGFHGLSHHYCAQRATEWLGESTPQSRLIICHLGSGCSVTAVQQGHPVATSMGMTPMDGVMMSTRSGSLDPGILLAMQKTMSVDEMNRELNRSSGLLGVSGYSGDFRQVLARAEQGDEPAQLAITMFADRIRSCVAGYAVNMHGVEAVVFTGGIGENSAAARQLICEGWELIGCHLDIQRNQSHQGDGEIQSASSSVRLLVLQTQEEWMAFQQSRPLLVR